MKGIVKKYTGVNLVLRIVCGLVLGAVLALVVPPALAGAPGGVAGGVLGFLDGLVEAFGTLFVGALKGIAPLLVFLLVSSALACAHVGGGATMKRVIVLYITGTVAAALLAVVMAHVFPVEMVFPSGADLTGYDPPDGIGEVVAALLANIVANPIASIANANYLGVLFWSILVGLALRAFATEGLLAAMRSLSDAVTQIVRWIIECAPFGIMGLVYAAVSDSGMGIFVDYGWLLAVLVASMLAMFFIINPLIVFLNTRMNPYPLVWRCITRSAFTAFFTRSSAANIPVNLGLCEEMGLDEDNYSISIPLGTAFNMEGAAITIATMTLAACHTLGIEVGFGSAILLCILSAIGACGASGVAGGSLLLIPMACSLFGISGDIAMSVVAVGFVIGVIQDSMETALNSSTDALFTATAEIALCKKQRRPLPAGVPGVKAAGAQGEKGE